MSLPAAYFECLFAASDDPWSFRTRWYEKRKRALTLAVLPRQRYRRVFEPACANGELSLCLAQRSEALVCSDLSAEAVRLTRQRLAAAPHAQVHQGSVPGDWPEGEFDLIVLGEFGYYLDPDDWRQVLARAVASLSPDGSLLACHWLPPIADCPQDGRQVHAILDAELPLTKTVSHEEADFMLGLWCRVPGRFDLQEDVL